MLFSMEIKIFPVSSSFIEYELNNVNSAALANIELTVLPSLIRSGRCRRPLRRARNEENRQVS